MSSVAGGFEALTCDQSNEHRVQINPHGVKALTLMEEQP